MTHFIQQGLWGICNAKYRLVTPGNACLSSVCLLPSFRIGGSQAYVQGIRVWTLSDVPCSRKVVVTYKGADGDKAGPSTDTDKGNPTVTPTYEIPTDSESGHKARHSLSFGCWHSCRPCMLILITTARPR